MSIIALLVWLIVLVVVMYVAYLIAVKFIVDSTLRAIVLLLLGLAFLLIFLSNVGLLSGTGLHL